MKRQDHLRVDKFTWDKEYNDVHQWLDECFPKYAGRNPYMHWLERHYLDAIKEEYGEFTLEYNVAYMHILFDYLSHFQFAYVPKTKKDAESMLKSLGALRDGTENFC
jgi:hypothetical protein